MSEKHWSDQNWNEPPAIKMVGNSIKTKGLVPSGDLTCDFFSKDDTWISEYGMPPLSSLLDRSSILEKDVPEGGSQWKSDGQDENDLGDNQIASKVSQGSGSQSQAELLRRAHQELFGNDESRERIDRAAIQLSLLVPNAPYDFGIEDIFNVWGVQDPRDSISLSQAYAEEKSREGKRVRVARQELETRKSSAHPTLQDLSEADDSSQKTKLARRGSLAPTSHPQQSSKASRQVNPLLKLQEAPLEASVSVSSNRKDHVKGSQKVDRDRENSTNTPPPQYPMSVEEDKLQTPRTTRTEPEAHVEIMGCSQGTYSERRIGKHCRRVTRTEARTLSPQTAPTSLFRPEEGRDSKAALTRSQRRAVRRLKAAVQSIPEAFKLVAVPPSVSSNCKEEEQASREKGRIRNREAVRKCRQRIAERKAQLEQERKLTERENQELRSALESVERLMRKQGLLPNL